MKQAILGIILYGILCIPPLTNYMESIMIVHMLIQLPLLILVGWLIGKPILRKFQHFFANWNTNGVPGIILFIFITMYWMLPRAIDEAVSEWYIELFKFIGLPIIGLCIRDSWSKIQTLGRSFIFLNYLPMFGLMAWLYIDSPIQICNNYLESQQKVLGWGFLVITIWMVLYVIQAVFTDQSDHNTKKSTGT
ncbi:hypothetical protein J2Z40_002505 [Cytobacillus eiseniae]|uniref:DUF1404 domain-containing protein n=1 Tax=Cytobacillus eiseniae TaxID=762947 RepID=A0ABS4RGA9_9BACI|nr:hypothetical protein [Cytobacillus eiseniae]MBP2241932.1 hypothetical protein [Cytobacillus eiseniae]